MDCISQPIISSAGDNLISKSEFFNLFLINILKDLPIFTPVFSKGIGNPGNVDIAK